MTKQQYRAYVRRQAWMLMVAALGALAVSIAVVIWLGLHCKQSCSARERVATWNN